MDNHFHLFLRTPNADLSAGMHDLNSGYASWFNRRHRRVGSLFQGRFKAILVEDESYAWTLSRYIHLNPVRAGMVKRPEQHAWSSYRHFLNARGAPDWLDWKTVLDEMGKNRSRTRQTYRQFVEQGLSKEIASPLSKLSAKYCWDLAHGWRKCAGNWDRTKLTAMSPNFGNSLGVQRERKLNRR